MTLRGILDTEVIPNRLYAATNIFYTPDYARSPGKSWGWSATLRGIGRACLSLHAQTNHGRRDRI